METQGPFRMLVEKRHDMGKLKEHFIDELGKVDDLVDDSYCFELWKEQTSREAFRGKAFLALQEKSKTEIIEKIERCQTKI